MDVSINTLERTTDNDIVITAHWNAAITDGEFNASAYGSQSFTRDEAMLAKQETEASS